MSQNQQYQKVKLYRALKIVFYMLGLPLFMVAVCFTTVKFLGHDPFMGDTVSTSALGFFMQVEAYVTAPALYGVWIAFALWAVISIVHIILAKTVKSSRVRMFAVVATCLVVMLVSGFVMDAVFESQIEQIAADAKKSYGDGVTVADYKTQLSYYRTLSSNAAGKNETTKLIEKIDLIKKAYNVEMEGKDKGGVAGNISNKPVTYGYLISDEVDGMVEVGVDISFTIDENTGASRVNADKNNNIEAGDGLITDVERNQVVELKPIDGKLVINGVTYSNYWYKEKGYKTVQYDEKKGEWVTVTPEKGDDKNNQYVYVWYSKDLMPVGTVYVDENGKELPAGAAGGTVSVVNTTDGDYGTGIYNPNGLFSDGWVFSVYNVLEILEDYYESQALVTSDDYKDEVAMVIQNAIDARDAYYTTEASARETAYYEQEVYFSDRFSLTHGRLDYLVAQVGALLGDNQLFDLLLDKNASGDYGASEIMKQLAEKIPLINSIPVKDLEGNQTTIANIISPILEKLEKGWSLKDMGADMNSTVGKTTLGGLIKSLVGVGDSYELKNASLVLVYKGEIFGQKKDHLYVALVRSDEDGNMGTNPAKATEGGDVLLDIDFDNTLLGEDDYAFDLDHLSQFLNTALDGVLNTFGIDLYNILVQNTIGKLVGGLVLKDLTVNGETVKGLSISGIEIPLFKEAKRADGSTYYQPVIDITAILVNVLQGLYSYQSPLIKPFWEFIDPEMGEVDAAVKKFYKAQYEAQTYGKMIGSILVGDTIGAGTYPSALGLTDLDSVRQVKVDLSYKPTMYPLFSLRDMIMFFTGLVVFFYFLSFVCAEKEREYADGTAIVTERKKRNKKKGKDVLQDENANQDADVANAVDPPALEDTALPAEENTQKEVE